MIRSFEPYREYCGQVSLGREITNPIRTAHRLAMLNQAQTTRTTKACRALAVYSATTVAGAPLANTPRLKPPLAKHIRTNNSNAKELAMAEIQNAEAKQ